MDMRLSVLGRDWLPVLFGFALGFAGVLECRAGDIRTYFISATAGSGAEECLADGGECGTLVADAWCNAHGKGVAIKFGRSADNSEDASDSFWPAPERYYVACGD
jgi:hypothetical protein